MKIMIPALASRASTRNRPEHARRPVTSAALFALLGTALASCSGTYGLEIRISLPDGDDPEAYDYRTSVYAPATAAAVGDDCVDFDWGEHDPSELSSALVGTWLAEEGPGVEVPRLGRKLVLVEAFGTESQKLALRGCAVHDEVEEVAVVDVALEPAARLELVRAADEPLFAHVPFDGPGVVEPAPTVAVFDHEGSALPGVPVRVTLRGPAGESALVLGEDGELKTDADGLLLLDELEVETFGPFTLDARPKVPAGPLPEPEAGFSVPAETVVEPFGPDAAVVRVTPVPLGPSGIAFGGVVRTGALAFQLRFALPQLGAGLPTFEVVEPEGLLANNPVPFGVVHDPDAGENVLLLQGRGAGSVWRTTTEQATLLVPGDQTVEVEGETLALSDIVVERAYPLGSCEVHERAGPAIIRFEARLSDGTEVARALFTDPLSDPPVFTPLVDAAAFARVLRSLCLAHPDGALHRVLVGTDGTGRITVFDLGDGVSGLPDLAGLKQRIDGEAFPLPGAVTVGSTAGPSPQLLFGSVGGFSAQVEEVSLSADDDAVIGAPALLYSLPGPPLTLGSGAFTGPERREDYHLISFASDEGAATPARLTLVTGAIGGEGPVSVGSVELSACPGNRCTVLPGDVDGDGVAELYVGRSTPFDPGGEGDPDEERVMAEVLRFTSP